MFLVLDIKYHFTCDEWNLYSNPQEFYNFMSVIVERRVNILKQPSSNILFLFWVAMLWGNGLFHPTKSQNQRVFKDMTIFYNTPLHPENIILTEQKLYI